MWFGAMVWSRSIFMSTPRVVFEGSIVLDFAASVFKSCNDIRESALIVSLGISSQKSPGPGFSTHTRNTSTERSGLESAC